VNKNTDTMTPAEALIWLASLEKDCQQKWWQPDGNPVPDDGPGSNHPDQCQCLGNGEVPVLDLRKPCPCPIYVAQTCEPCWQHGAIGHGVHCLNCQGRNWVPKQERDALFEAMEKDGWDYVVSHRQGIHSVRFFKVVGRDWAQGDDADDWLAAVKAMKAAGH